MLYNNYFKMSKLINNVFQYIFYPIIPVSEILIKKFLKLSIENLVF